MCFMLQRLVSFENMIKHSCINYISHEQFSIDSFFISIVMYVVDVINRDLLSVSPNSRGMKWIADEI